MTEYSPEIVARGVSISPASAHRWLNSIGLTIAVGVAYFLAAHLSLFLLTKPDGVAVFWPAAGVSSGVLISLGSSARLPVIAGTMVATVLANLLGDRNIWSAIIFAVCNAGEAVLVAAVLERYFGPSFGLDRLRNVIGLVLATTVGTLISGAGGTLGFELFHNSPTSLLTIWRHWFASDALGIITVAPLLIGCASAVRDPPPRSEAMEGAVALVILTIASMLIALLPREAWVAVVPTALLFPLLLWVSARCRPVFAATAAFIVALMVFWTTTFGIGILGDPVLPIGQRVLVAQSAILTTSFCALVIAALFAERKANEIHLAHSNMMLERERDNKLMNVQAVTAAMAHELKQPLTAISANSEAIQLFVNHTKPNRKEIQSALGSIIADCHRASRILSDVRHLFAKTDIEQELVDVNRIARQALRLLREQLKAHGVTVHLELASDLPLVMGHRGQLQEVMINLLQNAIDAMNAVQIERKTLQLTTARSGDDKVIVAVKDSGPGIHPADLNRIFDAFFTTKVHGTGLGLAISHMIIDRHGGQLSVSSDGTNGAVFQFVLPTRDAVAHKAAALN